MATIKTSRGEAVSYMDVAASYTNAGVVYASQEKYEEALEVLQKSLQIKNKLVGHDPMDVATSYMNVANVYDSQGKYEEALDMHRKSLDIKIKVVGHDHKEVADSKWNMAMMFETQGKRDEGTLLLDSETLVPISR